MGGLKSLDGFAGNRTEDVGRILEWWVVVVGGGFEEGRLRLEGAKNSKK